MFCLLLNKSLLFEKVTVFSRLFYEEHYDRTDKDKRCRSDTEISNLAAIVPLHIALAKHSYTHQRHKDVDCLIPNIKYLQYCQYYDG